MSIQDATVSVDDLWRQAPYASAMVARSGKRRAPHLFITEWMADRGLSDEQLAERLSTNRVTMWRWRREQHRLNPDKIAQIAAALGIEPRDLWRPPSGRVSIDAMLAGLPDETHAMAADIVRRLLPK